MSSSDSFDRCGRDGATITFIILSSITFAAATVFIPLRMYVQLRLVNLVWWDDITILVAYVSASLLRI